MYRYLYIFEDGSMKIKKEKPTREDCQSIDAGLLQVIRTNGCFEEMTVDGKWVMPITDETYI